jgi:hypothetical protein
MKNLRLIVALLAFFTLAVKTSALDFTIAGAGATQTGQGSNTGFGTQLSLEKFVSPHIMVGLAQGISYSDTTTSTLRFATEGLAHYNIQYTVLGFTNTAYAGASLRTGYGDGAHTFTAGPVVGNKWFVKPNVYVVTQVNYDVGINRAANNAVRYTLGLGVRF